MSTMLKPNLSLLIQSSLVLFFITSILLYPKSTLANSDDPTKYWDVQSVDTMKFSRDMAAAKINDPSFDSEIESQAKNIKSSGANFIAIDTPYDTQFLPYLKRWVNAARDNNLHIWFRGNFAAWEGWFGVPKGMSTDDHTKRTVDFITQNPDLFEDGDIFSSCPECENGSFGDPRQNNRVDDYRKFIISETNATTNAFGKINKKVLSNYWSMNLDVAKLVMDKDTAHQVGVVVIDHYVADPNKLISDANDIGQKTGVPVVIGEFGAPIPDLNGNMSNQDQAKWIQNVLNKGSASNSIIGLNYWVGKGGSTAIWDDNNNPKQAAVIIASFFNPNITSGTIIDEFGDPVKDATIKSGVKITQTDKDGKFTIIRLDPNHLTINKDDYDTIENDFPNTGAVNIPLIKTHKNLIDLIRLWFRNAFK